MIGRRKRWLGRYPAIMYGLHVTNQGICHGAGIEAQVFPDEVLPVEVFPSEAFPGEGTGTS